MLTKETREQLEALQKANPDLVIPELDPNYQPKNGVGGGRRHQPNRISPEAIPVGFKQCSRCGRVLQNAAADAAAGLGEFGVDKSGKDGRKSSCRVCCTEASRESTARTRGLPYECKSDIKAVKEAFPSFDGDQAKNEAWTAAHPPAASGGSGTRTRTPRPSQAAPAPDTSPEVGAGEDGMVTI